MKLHNLTIKNFRSFDHFTLNHLGRVNLLVGTNNSGKTTVLEALFILLAAGDQKLATVSRILSQRGEVSVSTDTNQSGLDVRRLFGNHRFEIGSQVLLQADSDQGLIETALAMESIRELIAQKPKITAAEALHLMEFSKNPVSDISFTVKWKPKTKGAHDTGLVYMSLQTDGILGSMELNARTRRNSLDARVAPVNFVSALSLSGFAIKSFYERVVLTPEEDLVIEMLRIVEPDVQRVASGAIGIDVSAGVNAFEASSHRGLLVRLAGVHERLPIGSMGDGIWRLLGLALMVIHSQNGTLLIDEIDTGLHYSVMDKMWRFLDECSKRFNVQIIATTHSRDCYQSLAAICRGEIDEESQSEITIQRIERNRSESVVYSEAAIIAAAERNVEVR